jgi:hypothetical protein
MNSTTERKFHTWRWRQQTFAITQVLYYKLCLNRCLCIRQTLCFVRQSHKSTTWNVNLVTYWWLPSARRMRGERGSRTEQYDGRQTCGHLQITTTSIAPEVSTTSAFTFPVLQTAGLRDQHAHFTSCISLVMHSFHYVNEMNAYKADRTCPHDSTHEVFDRFG